MKILLITEDYPPTSGGIAQWAFGIVRELISLKHDVTVLTRSGIFQLEEFEFSGERIVKMNSWKWTEFRSIYIAYYSLKECFFNKPDLVIASTWNIGAFLASIKKAFSFKVVLAYHGLEVTKQLNAKRRFKLLRAIKNADLNIAVSHFTKNEIVSRYNIDERRITVIHNGVDTSRFYPKKKSTKLIERYKLQGKFVLLSLSRVIERKGHDIVIQALPNIIKKHPNLIYLIAGVYDETFYKKLTQLIQDLNLEEHVLFTGVLPSDEIIDYYNLCDLYIMVSKGSGKKGDSEGFGITYLEANACGKAVIASNTDGIPDAVEDKVNGVLVEANNVEETEKAILLLLENEQRSKDLAEQALKRIKERFTWEKITTELLESLDE